MFNKCIKTYDNTEDEDEGKSEIHMSRMYRLDMCLDLYACMSFWTNFKKVDDNSDGTDVLFMLFMWPCL